MDPKSLRDLLDKYYQGETSLEEEASLRSYFQQNQAPAEFGADQDWFRMIAAQRAQQPQLSADFTARLNAKIQQPRPLWPRKAKPQTWILRIAAAVLLALSVWFLYPDWQAVSPEPTAAIDWSKYEPATVEEAYHITRKALLHTSVELNRGTGMAAQEMEHFGEMGKMFK
ncbi:MAG: hypothetical protein H6555_06705 [Lewinellaceae bacterium]|nr:hypothetical protein [Lewinellaceae bacterium]